MSYTDNLIELQEMMNKLFDNQEAQIKRLIGIIIDLKAYCYSLSPDIIVEKIKRIQL